MIPFTTYDASTGRIISAGRARSFADAARQAWAGHHGWLPVASDPAGDWVDLSGTTGCQDDTGTFVDLPGVALPRPSLPRFDKTEIAADGVDAAVVAGLPVGCAVTVDGVGSLPVEGGTLTLTSTMPATYHVVVSRWPYLDYAETVVAA